MLDLRGEGLRLLIGDPGVVLTQVLQDNIGDMFYLTLLLLPAADVVHLAGDKIIRDIGQGATGILHVVKDTLVPHVNGVGFTTQVKYMDYAKSRRYLNHDPKVPLTKWAGELMVLNSAAMFGTETVRVRPVNAYGPHEHYHPYRGVVPAAGTH